MARLVAVKRRKPRQPPSVAPFMRSVMDAPVERAQSAGPLVTSVDRVSGGSSSAVAESLGTGRAADQARHLAGESASPAARWGDADYPDGGSRHVPGGSDPDATTANAVHRAAQIRVRQRKGSPMAPVDSDLGIRRVRRALAALYRARTSPAAIAFAAAGLLVTSSYHASAATDSPPSSALMGRRWPSRTSGSPCLGWTRRS
jgi:hypothetical protein